MHLSDTLVFGPPYPLLLRPVRVRLGALLVGLVGGCGILTLAGVVLVLGTAVLPASARSLLPEWASPAEPSATAQQILISSNPAGAAVLIGGPELGRTPATVSTFPGLILTLRRAGFLDAFVAVGAPTADVTLWRAEPDPVLVVATTSAARVRAWARLVEEVSRARGWPPLQVNVTTWATIGQDTIKRVEHRARAGGRVCARDLARA
jgi:hypothetical protein